MSQNLERRRLESYVEEYDDDDSDGMGLEVVNVEGGGSNCPDESENYERRLQWLKETNGGHSDEIWKTLAEGEHRNRKPDEGEELVYIEIPGWFVVDDDDLNKIFTNAHKGETITTFAIFKVEASEDSKAYAFGEIFDGIRWNTPMNQYKTAWIPKKITTIYQRSGEPRPVDKARVRRREALPDNVDPFEAEDDDYDWRLALGAAYRRTEGLENDPLAQAYNNAEETLPDKLFQRLEIATDEYMRRKRAEGEEVGDDEFAVVINSFTEALKPGATSKKEDKEE